MPQGPTLFTRIRRRFARWYFQQYPPQARNNFCSFCDRPYYDAEPFAEGPAAAMICADCIRKCDELIQAELARRNPLTTHELPYNG